ncbi:MAG: bifunctional diaminohydroxyphosphoribosylaminopyrimidine deaminase/5-amino-6-(5-phosphoribosylamino)uracil reductase RibD [Paracoccaceae bacterium]
MNSADTTHMRHALALGVRGLGRTWPNPSVGCVIVSDGKIVGRGWTGDGGVPHAETVALAQAGSAAKGATVYVTLEPCSHHGRTPPCVEALISAGVSRVLIASPDPNPAVDGQGAERLRAAGIQVVTGVLQAETQRQHAGFFSRISLGRPMLTLKLAASFDGRIATAGGDSQWITGAAARRVVHMQRAQQDAVMIGGGTARHDDPMLNVRDLGITRQPVRIVWSRHLDLPLQGKLAHSAKEIPLWILHAQGADRFLCDTWSGCGARLFPIVVGRDRQLDPVAALSALGAAGLTRIYCEGGGALAASLLAADLVDALICFTAGVGLGADGLPMLGPQGLRHLSAAKRFQLLQTRAIGVDTMTQWHRIR